MFASQDQDNRRAGARGLARYHHGALARSLRRAAAGAVCAAAVALPVISAASAQAAITPAYTPLTLVNGWTGAGPSTAGPAARNISGIVHLEGATLTSGTNPLAFTLPAGDRPAHDIFVKVDLCHADNGQLSIAPSGSVTVQAEGGNWANAQCFTSLDGASFAR